MWLNVPLVLPPPYIMRRRDHIQIYRDYGVPLLSWEIPSLPIDVSDDEDENATLVGETEEFFYQPYDF
jgi:hypothetical protein